MNALTQNERDGLDDVFLSIHSNQDKLRRIKEISTLIISKKSEFSIKKLLRKANYGIKQTKFAHFLRFISKKKKNLS